ncbi:MAG: hypothetical protein Q8K05_00155 [Polaromonas sp.]|uniref:hypothetical protein n=1 Tax=Polaromonas sp. TaxID=1869339 RepID=UPI002730264D|nr:hypothetical protein [Polaromonas sp.]MDP2254463.1 hypothetical protein [Polaromonas sp.]MDP3707042.1 hypothetical protein [Polaromonas sp.]
MPNVSRQLCESAQLRPGTARSVKGQVIWVRDAKPDNASLRVLVVGAIHGDEPASAALAFHWIRLADPPLLKPGAAGPYV